MSRWNNYAKVLNNTFADYRKEYAAAYDRVAAAKRKADSYTENRPFTTYDLQKQAAAAEYQEAQRAFKSESRSICERYSAAVDQLMSRFREAVEKEFSVRPEFIDQNAMELLKSGIMGVADYESMLSRYSDNPTMLRLIGKYANEEAEKSDTADRQSFRAIAINAGTEQGGKTVAAFEDMAGASKGYFGCYLPSDGDYVQRMQSQWDGAEMQQAIADF